MEVIIYSTTTCPYCKMLKDYLKERGVSFVEKLVDQDEEAKKQMEIKSGGFLGVPFTVVTKEGTEEKIIGFDRGRLNAVLGLQ